MRGRVAEMVAANEEAQKAHECKEAVWKVELASLQTRLKVEEQKGAEAAQVVEVMRGRMLEEAFQEATGPEK